jgi:hypothetical protein
MKGAGGWKGKDDCENEIPGHPSCTVFCIVKTHAKTTIACVDILLHCGGH